MTGTKIPIIRKEKFKEYLFPGMFWGVLAGFLFFLISLINDSFTQSVKTGFGWMGAVLLISLIGFFSEEWYHRKRKLKKLQSGKYEELLKLGLKIDKDLNITGNIKGYNVEFYLNEKYIKPNKYIDQHYVNINCLPQNFKGFQNVLDNIQKLPGVKNTGWGFGILSIIYKEKSEDFVLPIKLALNFLEEAAILPLSKPDWEKLFGNEIKLKREQEEKARTKQIIKIGKLDIKYIKPK